MAKIERKYLAHYIDASVNGEPVYEQLGKDLEEFSPEMSAQVETKKNILGATSIVISSYEKTASVEPFYAEKDSALFNRLQTIIDEQQVLDDLKVNVVEVKLWDEQDGGVYPAVREEAYVEINSYGGDTTGYQIPFTLHYTGKKTKGTFDVSTRVFTEA
jgi:hypothetical protein